MAIVLNMSDLLEEDLEFRGGTLQLSTDAVMPESSETNRTVTADTPGRRKTPTNANPSVLSGADSLTSSTCSFAGTIYLFNY